MSLARIKPFHFSFPRPRLPGLAPLLLAAGCSLQPPAPSVPLATPGGWQAPLPATAEPTLPHHSSQQRLLEWWQQAGDPALPGLIEAAQAASPTVGTARSRFLQARATRMSAGAALGPTLDATAQTSRGFSQIAGGIATQNQAGLQASWEIDLFGANSATRDAAQARLEGAQAQWHDARISVAAEVANELNNFRSCRRELAIQESDAASRAESARLTDLAMRAGFSPPPTPRWRAPAAPKPPPAPASSAPCATSASRPWWR